MKIITITVIYIYIYIMRNNIITIKKNDKRIDVECGEKQKIYIYYIYIRDLFCFLYRRFYIFKYFKAEILKSTGAG